MDIASNNLNIASVDSTSDTLTLANENNTSESLTLASVDRENHAPWEFEYSYQEEADLHRHYDRCKKNPGHKNFIPVDKFSLEDLPEDYREKDLVNFIQAVSDITVRVTVKYVSDRSVPGSCQLSPGSSVRDQRRMAVGTGWVRYVFLDSDHVGETCKCKDCQKSSTPEISYGEISIHTAAHLFSDDIEVERITCHLFFDRGSTPDTCSDVVTLTGTFRSIRNVNVDICTMLHYTHNLDLAHRLKQAVSQMYEQKRDICTKMQQICKFKPRLDVLDRQPLLFIVSHPHGCSKQVSLGRLTGAHVFIDFMVSFLYNTATCPGSSGARIFVLQAQKAADLNRGKFFLDGVHCGASILFPQINYCGAYKRWADNFCCVEEEDQNQHYAACKKNPGHGNFFPVEKFSMDNLPPFYRRDNVMKFIKAVSDLTVRVSVKYVSEKRPATVPGTDIPYPWFSNRGSNRTRVGSGWIEHAPIFNLEDCDCKECRSSPKPKPRSAWIEIKTVAHLVYDELEAEYTTCHLFFDSGETPADCKNVVTLSCMCYFSNDLNDTCTIRYVTHDLDLAFKLCTMSKLRNDIQPLRVKKDVKQNVVESTTQEPPLHIVVSHPHGCAKQISIGYNSNPGNADTEDSQYLHPSIVCPGSSGAPVILPYWRLFYAVFK